MHAALGPKLRSPVSKRGWIRLHVPITPALQAVGGRAESRGPLQLKGTNLAENANPQIQHGMLCQRDKAEIGGRGHQFFSDLSIWAWICTPVDTVNTHAHRVRIDTYILIKIKF